MEEILSELGKDNTTLQVLDIFLQWRNRKFNQAQILEIISTHNKINFHDFKIGSHLYKLYKMGLIDSNGQTREIGDYSRVVYWLKYSNDKVLQLMQYAEQVLNEKGEEIDKSGGLYPDRHTSGGFNPQ